MTDREVLWQKNAKIGLQAIYWRIRDRDRVMPASRQLTARLKRDAASEGRPLSEGLWVAEHDQLRAVYVVDELPKTVEVIIVSWVLTETH